MCMCTRVAQWRSLCVGVARGRVTREFLLFENLSAIREWAIIARSSDRSRIPWRLSVRGAGQEGTLLAWEHIAHQSMYWSTCGAQPHLWGEISQFVLFLDLKLSEREL